MSHRKIEDFVRELNEAWTRGEYGVLYDYFDKDVVMEVPGNPEPIVGVDALVKSYRDFGDSGVLNRFEVTEIQIFSYRSVAVCHLDFAVDYQIDGAEYSEKGRDIYVINASEQGEYSIVWRTQHEIPNS